MLNAKTPAEIAVVALLKAKIFPASMRPVLERRIALALRVTQVEIEREVGQLEKQQGRPRYQQPAVPIEKSIYPNAIICLEDGKPFKMLKRYLRAQYNLTPEQYRIKWGLPPDYPMVAPNYSKEKSSYAKAIGLAADKLSPSAQPTKKKPIQDVERRRRRR
jgi:predicted transcriptional regulator